MEGARDGGRQDPPARPALPPLTAGMRWALGVLGTASGALAGMAFVGMFSAVKTAVRPWAHGLAWMVPAGTDLGIVILSAIAIWLEWAQKDTPAGKRLNLWWLRGLILTLIGLQLGINVGSAHGDPFGSAVHAVLPVLFVSILEVWQFIIRWRRGLVSDRDRRRKRDKIPFARYLADFRGSREIRRHMILWGVTSYTEALDMLQKKRRAESSLAVMSYAGNRPPEDLVFMLSTSKYLDDACAEIARLRKNFDKWQNPKPAFQQPPGSMHPDRGAGAGSGVGDGEQAAECCEAHMALALKKILPLGSQPGNGPADPIGNAARINEAHIAVHGSAIGADNLRLLFRIGTPNARKLRDDLRARRESGGRSGPESGHESGTGPESGRAVRSGPESGHALAGVGAWTGRATMGGDDS